MKTEAGYEFQTYEPSGHELRIHWNIEQKNKEVMDGEIITYWEANEALCNVYDNRSQLIEKIIGAEYTPSQEIATINNKDRKPEEYAAYQAFREQAKALADGWLNK
jgi:predicted Mrr-cat superfamily restriction endonuclease